MIVLEASHPLPSVVFPSGLCQPANALVVSGDYHYDYGYYYLTFKRNTMTAQLEENIQKYQVQGFHLRQHCLNSVALDGNPEPDLVHATGCKQPRLRYRSMLEGVMLLLEGNI
jgi:hypothetical protein